MFLGPKKKIEIRFLTKIAFFSPQIKFFFLDWTNLGSIRKTSQISGSPPTRGGGGVKKTLEQSKMIGATVE